MQIKRQYPEVQYQSILRKPAVPKKARQSRTVSWKTITQAVGGEVPEELELWRTSLAEMLHSMNPYAFERLVMLLLREGGFPQVRVTKKSGDGRIDGTGKLHINGIFSFNVAFQCKRYTGSVAAGDIRNFRGSLTTDIEKGICITTGSFTHAARKEALNAGKQQIDLFDGEEFIDKLIEYRLDATEKTIYFVDKRFGKI